MSKKNYRISGALAGFVEWAIRFIILAAVTAIGTVIALLTFPVMKMTLALALTTGASAIVALITMLVQEVPGGKVFRYLVFIIIFLSLAVPIGGAAALVAPIVGYPLIMIFKVWMSLHTATMVTMALGFIFGLTGAWSVAVPLWELATDD